MTNFLIGVLTGIMISLFIFITSVKEWMITNKKETRK